MARHSGWEALTQYSAKVLGHQYFCFNESFFFQMWHLKHENTCLGSLKDLIQRDSISLTIIHRNDLYLTWHCTYTIKSVLSVCWWALFRMWLVVTSVTSSVRAGESCASSCASGQLCDLLCGVNADSQKNAALLTRTLTWALAQIRLLSDSIIRAYNQQFCMKDSREMKGSVVFRFLSHYCAHLISGVESVAPLPASLLSRRN